MPNDFYTPTGNPTDNSNIVSSDMRAEFAAINAGFNKLPALTGNANKLVCVNSSGTGVDVVDGPQAVGYVTGAGSGGTVTQLTSKSTAVTLNTPTGLIITHNASLASGASIGFTLNNSLLTTESYIGVINSSAGNYKSRVGTPSAGSCVIYLENITAGALAEAINLRFMIFSGSNS